MSQPKTPPATLGALRKQADAHYRAGRVVEAIETIIEALNRAVNKTRIIDQKRLALYLSTRGDFKSAQIVLEEILTRSPDDIEIIEASAVCLSRQGDYAKAVERLERVLELDDTRPNTYDALAGAHGHLGNLDRSRAYGRQSLSMKSAANPARSWQACASPPFDPDAKHRNVIAFSLWGSKERFLYGALENARLVPIVYPQWTARFYCDESVPETTTMQLIEAGADVVMMPTPASQFEPLFWRFLVAGDPEIDRFLVRDCDSVVNHRERAAVDEWLASDKHFHVMRDYFTHSELILAGMWGGVRGALPDLSAHMARYHGAVASTRHCDQQFLREIIWPIVTNSVLIHDSVFDSESSRPFPNSAGSSASFHVGRDEYYYRYTNPEPAQRGRFLPGRAGLSLPQPRTQLVFTLTTGRSGTAYLAELLELNTRNTEVHHERVSFEGMGVTSPDASTAMLFNSIGNCAAVQDFWRRKFATVRHGTTPVYIETSHFLAKAGLLENLPALMPGVRVDIVVLSRDTVATAESLANRFDFVNSGFTWLLNLDPHYPRNVVPFDDYAQFGVIGRCVWYCHEMAARTYCYKILFKNDPNIRFTDVALENLQDTTSVAKLIRSLGLKPAPRLIIPEAKNPTKDRFVTDKERALIRRIHEQAWLSANNHAIAYVGDARFLTEGVSHPTRLRANTSTGTD